MPYLASLTVVDRILEAGFEIIGFSSLEMDHSWPTVQSKVCYLALRQKMPSLIAKLLNISIV
jgi:hypothetical protein